jgi:hypothetical protein
LSRFLQRALCYQDNSGMRAKPRLAHCSQLNSFNHDNFLTPRQLLPRHCALQPRQVQNNMTISQPPCKLCHDTRIPQLNRTWTAKTRAIPSWHPDWLLAQVPGSAECVRRVTQPPFIAVPLGNINRPHCYNSVFKKQAFNLNYLIQNF